MNLSESKYLPLVTIVTPSYNQGRFIEETIQSVISQDYSHIEYLVIDGGSTDNTLELLRKYTDNLTWVSEPDFGQSHAINKGFRMAKGEILCWLNSDDTFEPGAIRKVVEYMRSNPQTMLVYGDGNFIDEKGVFLSKFPYSCAFDLWLLVHTSDFILQPAAFFRATVLHKVGYLDEKLHWCMDWDLWIRIGKSCHVEYLPNCLANARIYGTTKTSQGGLRRMMEIVSMLHGHCKKMILPAYVLYGSGLLSTIQSRSSRFYWILRIFLWPIRILVRYFVTNAQGVYADGWLGRKANFMFSSEQSADSLIYTLDMPEDKRIVPNSVTITINGRRLPKKEIKVSGFIELVIPFDKYHQEPTDITLKFDRFLPYDAQMRRLVCRLIKVSPVLDNT